MTRPQHGPVPAGPVREPTKKGSGLRDRMGRLFAIQLAVISLATLIGIYITQLIIEDLLTRQALSLEAEHFWALYEENPGHPLPDVANMRGYMASLPVSTSASTAALPAGLHLQRDHGAVRHLHAHVHLPAQALAAG